MPGVVTIPAGVPFVEALAAGLKMEGESSAWAAMLRFQVASDLIASNRPEDRAEARALLEQALGVLEKQTPPPQRLAEVRAASVALK